MPKYSVIVPVYKVEAVLPRCIESILNQTITDFELILVDDGSPDGSGAICDAYAERDSRIRVIHQQNGGVSRARNAGLDAAKGEYIVFVDSDDYVDTTYLQEFGENPSDLTISGYRIEGYGYSEAVIRQYEPTDIQNMDKNDFTWMFERGMLNYACTKCFKTEIIRKHALKFHENMKLSEDTLFTLQYAMHCRSVYSMLTPGYHYVKYEHETLTGIASPFELIRKLESANEIIYSEIQGYLQKEAKATVARRISLLYKNILAESLDPKTRSTRFIYCLFRQKWLRKSLDHVDTIYADEDPKYRALLKTKSPTLFCLYRAYMKMRNR